MVIALYAPVVVRPHLVFGAALSYQNRVRRDLVVDVHTNVPLSRCGSEIFS